jgi:hypothetical protein
MKCRSRMSWLPDMDLNHDKQIQSLLCYRYTIGQKRALKVGCPPAESRLGRRAAAAPNAIRHPKFLTSCRAGLRCGLGRAAVHGELDRPSERFNILTL